jgi:hypothetical protein
VSSRYSNNPLVPPTLERLRTYIRDEYDKISQWVSSHLSSSHGGGQIFRDYQANGAAADQTLTVTPTKIIGFDSAITASPYVTDLPNDEILIARDGAVQVGFFASATNISAGTGYAIGVAVNGVTSNLVILIDVSNQTTALSFAGTGLLSVREGDRLSLNGSVNAGTGGFVLTTGALWVSSI